MKFRELIAVIMGRSAGLDNYDHTVLLSAIEAYKPVSLLEWQEVATRYQTETREKKLRKAERIKYHFKYQMCKPRYADNTLLKKSLKVARRLREAKVAKENASSHNHSATIAAETTEPDSNPEFVDSYNFIEAEDLISEGEETEPRSSSLLMKRNFDEIAEEESFQEIYKQSKSVQRSHSMKSNEEFLLTVIAVNNTNTNKLLLLSLMTGDENLLSATIELNRMNTHKILILSSILLATE